MIHLYAGTHMNRTLFSHFGGHRAPLASRSVAVTSRRTGAYGHLPLAGSRIDGPVNPVSEIGTYRMAPGPAFASLVGPFEIPGAATLTSEIPTVINQYLTEFNASATGHTPAG